MGVLVTLVVAIAILAAVSALAWPKGARAPLPLYAGTILLAFLVGMFAGQLAEGRELRRAGERSLIISPLILIVAVISWFRIGPTGRRERETPAPSTRPARGAVPVDSEPDGEAERP